MLELALASSCAPSMFRPQSEWNRIHELLIGDVPQPSALAEETDVVVAGYIERVRKGFEALSNEIERVRPEAIIVVGDDGGLLFDEAQLPQFCLYTGNEFKGTTALPGLGEETTDTKSVTVECDSKLSYFLLEELVTQYGFGISQSEIAKGVEKPARGTASAFIHPVLELLPKLDIPIVPLYINCYSDPAPSGHRCFELGQTIARILEEWPGKVAIYGAGGLSCDPFGPRAGWIDKPLDEWVLGLISRGKSDRLSPLFDVQSDTNVGGTGEIRSWITVAGAAGGDRHKANIVDYFSAHKALTGIAFAHWDS